MPRSPRLPRLPSLFVSARGAGQLIGRRTVGGTGYATLALGLLVLVGIVAASVWLGAANSSALEGVVRERMLLATANMVLTGVDQAETGQRGFLLTGKEEYLRPFKAAIGAVDPALDTLEQFAKQDTVMALGVRKLREVVSDKLAELDETIEAMKRGDREGALALVQTDRGQRDSNAIRAIADQIEDAQRAAINTRLAAINDRGKALIAMDTAALAVLVLLAAFIAYGIRAHLREMRAAQLELEIANRSLETSNETLERTVQVRTADLTEANEEIQRFAYIVSHDLRAPLVNIMGFTSELEVATGVLAGFLADGHEHEDMPGEVAAAANDDIPEAIRFIKASTAKMDRLINAILRLSRDGRRVLTPEPLNMGDMLETIVATLRHQASQREAAVSVGEMPALTADRLAVEQIFGNLVENALKYLKADRPGVVRIEGRKLGTMAIYDVRDNGRGVAARDHERIFELFRRAGDQTVPGEGIGLAHVRALVRRLGGAITCQSTLGEGTVFSVSLPLAPPPSTLAAAAARSIAA